MRLTERLRRLDERVVGPPAADTRDLPSWARVARAASGMLFYLLFIDVRGAGRWWVAATIACAAVAVPAYVLALRRTRAPWWRTTAAVVVVLGTAVVVAGAIAPRPGEQTAYHRGCHDAPRSVAARITRAVTGDYRLGRIKVFANAHAAVASAVVSGRIRIGGMSFPLDPTPVDWLLVPGTLTTANQLAGDVTPSLRGYSAYAGDAVDAARTAAERCAVATAPPAP